ncbi:hypothetical protein Vafri_8943 [Volvox africanus]|uniref:TatD related DNase n=1 Tax=Volvox africanus TaxID=51714 RepID=A0A8J4B3E0_9CHLO|nr:hypothetical protein Vafri_8943 [Volvox africanus]
MTLTCCKLASKYIRSVVPRHFLPAFPRPSSCSVTAGLVIPSAHPSKFTQSSFAVRANRMRFIDIGANLLDDMYDGRYNDKQYHPPDLTSVLNRAWAAGLQRLIITAGSLTEARKALALAKTDDRLFCTVGCHPTRCGEFKSHAGGAEAYLQELLAVLREGQASGKVVAVGECGLDYDRLHFCDAETQKKYFEAQFELARESGLPMFLHLRAAADDFLEIVQRHAADFPRGGVVHSFDGTTDEAKRILELPHLAIGLNGCSLKTEDNLAVVAALPLERIMIETDCPWCDIRPTHAGRKHLSAESLVGLSGAKDRKKHDPSCQVKSRNEPANIRLVLEVIAGVKGVTDLDAMAEQIYGNTAAMFFPEGTMPA